MLVIPADSLIRDTADSIERKAIEVLAVELDASGRDEQAEEARRLAWSPAAPSPEAAGTLVESVRESNGTPA